MQEDFFELLFEFEGQNQPLEMTSIECQTRLRKQSSTPAALLSALPPATDNCGLALELKCFNSYFIDKTNPRQLIT